MDRINRLVGTMLLLQSHRVIRAEDIARHFGISVRTVYRDLKALEEAGVPLAAEVGRGYSIVDGYHLPPVMFTQEEASALFIGAEFVKRLTDDSLRTHIGSALLKIHAVLPDDRRTYIDTLRASMAIYTRTIADQIELPHCLTTIQNAIVNRTVLRITYHSNTRDDLTQREIEPLGLIYYGDKWHAIAYCRLRCEVRDFRVDRIQSLDVLDERFAPHVDFSLKEYFEDARRSEPLQQVRVRFTAEAARHTAARHLFGFVEQVETADGVEMTFLTTSLRWIAGWLLSYGGSAVALDPPELRAIAREMACAVVDQYSECEQLA